MSKLLPTVKLEYRKKYENILGGTIVANSFQFLLGM